MLGYRLAGTSVVILVIVFYRARSMNPQLWARFSARAHTRSGESRFGDLIDD
jgi:hypothetical protein